MSFALITLSLSFHKRDVSSSSYSIYRILQPLLNSQNYYDTSNSFFNPVGVTTGICCLIFLHQDITNLNRTVAPATTLHFAATRLPSLFDNYFAVVNVPISPALYLGDVPTQSTRR